MAEAYLTIDDGPSRDTPAYLDFLEQHGIEPLLFFWGERLEAAWDIGLDAVRRGAVIGNHTYGHARFSTLTLDACIQDIRRMEELLDKLYTEAGVPRTVKVFRFPYNDKGGPNKDALQAFLRAEGFVRLDDRAITYDWYRAMGFDRGMDASITFNLQEYRLQYDASFAYEDILAYIADRTPEGRGSLYDGTRQIVLIHDHPETDSVHPGYFTDLIGRLLAVGVTFIPPAFV